MANHNVPVSDLYRADPVWFWHITPCLQGTQECHWLKSCSSLIPSVRENLDLHGLYLTFSKTQHATSFVIWNLIPHCTINELKMIRFTDEITGTPNFLRSRVPVTPCVDIHMSSKDGLYNINTLQQISSNVVWYFVNILMGVVFFDATFIF